MTIPPTRFEGRGIRRVHDEATDTWWFSVVDVVQVLTDSSNARRYWSDPKRKLAQEAGSGQPYEKIVQLKLASPDGKQRLTGQETRNKLTDYWRGHGIKEGQESAILTNLIHQEWAGVSVKDHKAIKGLKSHNPRDRMTEAETGSNPP